MGAGFWKHGKFAANATLSRCQKSLELRAEKVRRLLGDEVPAVFGDHGRQLSRARAQRIRELVSNAIASGDRQDWRLQLPAFEGRDQRSVVTKSAVIGKAVMPPADA